jgi:hypothetical protein
MRRRDQHVLNSHPTIQQTTAQSKVYGDLAETSERFSIKHIRPVKPKSVRLVKSAPASKLLHKS